jgi:hypothetical protein
LIEENKENRDRYLKHWIPVFTGMTTKSVKTGRGALSTFPGIKNNHSPNRF